VDHVRQLDAFTAAATGLRRACAVFADAGSTLGALVYNVCADVVGGIEVTLSEKE
jgi:hypothetical protein